jgi:hypothetical protein
MAAMNDHRVQVVLDKEQHRRLALEARRLRVSIGDVIRYAIDGAHPPDEPARRREAIDAILAAEPSRVPNDPLDLRRELDRARSGDR